MSPSVIVAEKNTTAASPAVTTTSKATTEIDSGDSFEIPTVDISTFLADPDSPGAQAIIPIVRSACRSTGLFQISGHGISKDLQQAMLTQIRALRGYDVLASQSYEDGVLPGLKEGFYRVAEGYGKK